MPPNRSVSFAMFALPATLHPQTTPDSKFGRKPKLTVALASMAFLCVVGGLSSCSSGSLVADLASLPVHDPDAASMVVMRKSQMTGAGGKVEVRLDGNLIGYLGSGDMVQFPVSPGEHFLEVSLAFKAFGAQEEVVLVNAETNKTYYFLYSLSIWDEMYKLEQLSEQEGRRQVSSGKFDLID